LQQTTSKQLLTGIDDTLVDGVKIRLSRIGNYLIRGDEPTTSLHTSSLPTYEAVSIVTKEKFMCKVLPLVRYKELLAPYFRVGCHRHIIELHEVIVGATCAYAFFPQHHGDLHSYVRAMRRLKDTEAARLFGQIASVVAHCHESGVVLRDLKLRKFVFKDAEKSDLILESLDDACLLDVESDDDFLCDRHGCPAYVSPEILSASDSTYSGRAADIWSLGVILFTMLVGRYPFHDPDPVALFRAIRHGRYTLPRHVMSEQAECLIRWILRCEPTERPAACEISRHPWFELCHRSPRQADRYHFATIDRPNSGAGATKDQDVDRVTGKDSAIDQLVPEGSCTFSNGSICGDLNIE
jgi:tribbles-like protein